MQSGTKAMVQFFQSLGHRVIQSENSWWYEVQPGVMMSFPYHRLLIPRREELTKIIEDHHLKALRFRHRWITMVY